MKFAKLKAGLLVSALTISSLGLGTASAQTNAYQTAFTTAVTYQNVGSGTATINLDFYAENGATVVAAQSLAPLAQNAATAIFVGNVNGLSAGFTGSGVLSSDQPLVATLVQIPAAASAVKNRPLSNGFSAGSPKVLIGTVLKTRFNTTSKFSIQNTDSGAVDLTVSFYAVGNPVAVHTITTANLPANAAKYYDAGAITQLPANFDGSVVVDVKKAGTQTPGSAVGSVMELNTVGTAASAFEGVAAGANTVYMASAICNTFNANSSYAVQNTGTAATNITVTYVAPDGVARSQTANNVAAGGKASFQGCGVGGAGAPSWAAFNGSATITASQPIIAIGKISGGGLSTAFVGSAAGADRVALPYVRWSATRYDTNQRDRQRTNLTIQNIGPALTAGQVTVKYYDKTGALVGTHTLGAITQNGKVNSNPTNIGAAGNEFGYYPDNTTGGSAIVEGPANSQLVVVARVSSSPATGLVGEDFSAIEIQ